MALPTSLPDYRKVTNEYLVPHSTAKYTKHNRDSYMVGALARFNNNYDQLHPRAKAAAEELGMKPIVTNSFLNTAAQAIEMVHCVEDSIRIIDELVDRGSRKSRCTSSRARGAKALAPATCRGASCSTTMSSTTTGSSRAPTASSPPTRTMPTSKPTCEPGAADPGPAAG